MQYIYLILLLLLLLSYVMGAFLVMGFTGWSFLNLKESLKLLFWPISIILCSE